MRDLIRPIQRSSDVPVDAPRQYPIAAPHRGANNHLKGKYHRQGNPVVRSVLVESSWILIGKDPEMRRFYERIKVRRGGKRAIVAVARKLCHRLLAIAQSGQPYQVNFSNRKEN